MSLWDENGEAIARVPEPKLTGAGWYLTPDNLPRNLTASRRRPTAAQKPNQLQAVASPLAGQSYNPSVEDHLSLEALVVKKLKRKQAEFERLKALLSAKPPTIPKSSKPLEDGVSEPIAPPKKVKAAAVMLKEKKVAEKKKARRAKKNSLDIKREQRLNRHNARHPDREAGIQDLKDIDRLKEELDAKERKSELRMLRRKVLRKENVQTKRFGRYSHESLIPDVATTSQLAGSLRHLTAKTVAHAALERVKSLEARNLIPARVDHKFNRRKVLRPKGEVVIVKETMGTLSE